jgi:hypothetical protein
MKIRSNVEKKIKDITVGAGGELGLIGMQITMDQQAKQEVIPQPKPVNQVIDAFKITKGVLNPGLIPNYRGSDKLHV